MEDDEYLPKDRYLDVEIESCSTSYLTRYLPEHLHANAKPISKRKLQVVGIAPGMLVRLISGSTPLIVKEVVRCARRTYITAVYYTSSNFYMYRVASDFVTFDAADEEAERLVRNAKRYIDMCHGSLTDKDIDLVAEFYNINPDEQGTKLMSDIYKTLESTARYGTKIAETSGGRIVLELKTHNGTVIADFEKDEIERVIPWTILYNGCHYKTPKDSVKVGDVIIVGGNIDVVKKVNTECDNAKNLPATARIVVTRAIGEPTSGEPVTAEITDTEAET